MAKKQRTGDGKRRTREHILADLSVNYVELLVLRCGFSAQRIDADYGYDLVVNLYTENGEIRNETIPIQLKASDNLQKYAVARESAFSFPISTKDYRLWSLRLLPALLVLYDAQMNEAYWIDVADLAKKESQSIKGKTIRIPVPQQNILGVRTFVLLRNQAVEIQEQLRQAVEEES